MCNGLDAFKISKDFQFIPKMSVNFGYLYHY